VGAVCGQGPNINTVRRIWGASQAFAIHLKRRRLMGTDKPADLREDKFCLIHHNPTATCTAVPVKSAKKYMQLDNEQLLLAEG
jgi:hypothetical protein